MKASKKADKNAPIKAEEIVEAAPSTQVIEEVPHPDASIHEADLKNKLRVQFSKPFVKKVVSHHSGTILADKDPEVPLSDELKEKATKIFHAMAEHDKHDLKRSHLAEVQNFYIYPIFISF